MHCTSCGTKLGSFDKYCAKCGNAVHAHSPRNRESRLRPEFLNTEGIEQYKALLLAKQDASRRKRSIVQLVVLIIIFILGVLDLAQPGVTTGNLVISLLPRLFIGLFFILFFSIIVTSNALSEKDYYSLRGSRNSKGEHQCLHCGHRGIYVKGQYKSMNKHHTCSKCKSYHFTTNS